MDACRVNGMVSNAEQEILLGNLLTFFLNQNGGIKGNTAKRQKVANAVAPYTQDKSANQQNIKNHANA